MEKNKDITPGDANLDINPKKESIPGVERVVRGLFDRLRRQKLKEKKAHLKSSLVDPSQTLPVENQDDSIGLKPSTESQILDNKTVIIQAKPALDFMDEEEKTDEVLLSSTTNEIEKTIQSVHWQNLKPAFENKAALLPREISLQQLQALISTFDSTYFDNFDLSDPAFEELDIPRFGKLIPLGSGQDKRGYMLKTPDGKQLAVLIQKGYNGNLEIPTDPHLYLKHRKTSSRGEIETYSYTDFNNYLSIPLMFKDKNYGIHIQEFGKNIGLKNPFLDWIKPTQERVERYVKDRGLNIVDYNDFIHQEHYFNRGFFSAPAVIDITLDNDQSRRQYREKDPYKFHHRSQNRSPWG